MDGLLSESSVMLFGNSEPIGIDLPLCHCQFANGAFEKIKRNDRQ